MPSTDERARRYAVELTTHVRDELSRADTKASILLAAVSVSLGAVAGGLVTKGWSPFRLSHAVAPVWWVGIAVVGGGTAALLAALYPRRFRVPAGPPRYIGYYGDVIRCHGETEVTAAVRRSVGPDELQLICWELLKISLIVDRKYRWLRRGVWLLGIGVLLDVAALLINAA